MLAAPSGPPPALVEMSTIAPAVARELAERLRRPRRRLPRLPGQRRPGGRGRRHAGVHVRRRRRRARPAPPPPSTPWATPAKRVHCGAVGLGLVAKLVNNMLVGVDRRRHRRGARRRPARGPRPGARPRGGDGLVRRLMAAAQPLPARARRATTRPASPSRNLLKDLGHARDLDERPAAVGGGGPRPAGADPPGRRLRRAGAPPDGPAVARLTAAPGYLDCESRTARSA